MPVLELRNFEVGISNGKNSLQLPILPYFPQQNLSLNSKKLQSTGTVQSTRRCQINVPPLINFSIFFQRPEPYYDPPVY